MKRLLIILSIAVAAFLFALLVGAVGTRRGDDFFYDAFYRLRPIEDMSNAEVVIVAADQGSMDAVDAQYGEGWPWPRTYWGEIAGYLDKAGAKVIGYDIVFEHKSAYRDDAAFAELIKKVKAPVVFGASFKNGDWGPFALPLDDPNRGAINEGGDKVYRWYTPDVEGQPSLAEAAAIAAGGDLRWLQGREGPFLLHYYGPHKNAAGRQTFRYISAYAVLAAAREGAAAEKRLGFSPEIFKGKIVLIGAIAVGAFDLKVSPLSDEYPGTEVQATAVENMLHAQYVHTVPRWTLLLVAALCALFATAGIVLPRSAALKILLPMLVVVALLGVCIFLFRAGGGGAIHWLSPVLPAIALVTATPLAFGYTYFAEDRQRRFMLKALSKVVSPAIAHELSQNPERLALGTVRTEITVLFTDLANFTDLAEGMDVQTLGTFINRYLGEMSSQVFAHDGTLDKYIGDAVMAFWNAPLPQEDHAARACRAALGMMERERALQVELAGTMGGRRVFTRIGVHTATVAVGFIGSEHLYNYTAMGDGVNLASRMEGANKLYGTRVLISEVTAKAVGEAFYLRRIDILRVKGKKQPMAVYELMAEKGGGAGAGASDLEARVAGYEGAFAHYLARRWNESEQMLLELSQRFVQDDAFAALLARVQHFRLNPPPDGWDGVYVSESK